MRHIRKLYPDLIVIMFSTLSERGAAITLEALTLGANDYVTKVANSGSLDQSMVKLRGELVPKFKQFFILESDPAAAPPKHPVAARTIPAALRPASSGKARRAKRWRLVYRRADRRL